MLPSMPSKKGNRKAVDLSENDFIGGRPERGGDRVLLDLLKGIHLVEAATAYDPKPGGL